MSAQPPATLRRAMQSWFRYVPVAFATALGLWCLGMLLVAGKSLPAAVFPAYFVGLLLVLTIANRSLPIRWVAGMALVGATTVPLTILLASLPFSRWLGADSHVFRSAVVPILEETLKIAPVLILLRHKRWRYRATVGASDLLLLGAAAGAGLAFYEDVVRGWVPGYSADAILAIHSATPHRGVAYLFPHMRTLSDAAAGAGVFIGHGGGTALIGVALGLARLLRGRLGRVPSWILPLAAWGWVVFDHSLFGLVSGGTGLPRSLDILWRIDLRGMLSSIVLYTLILASLVLERGILRRAREYIAGLDLSAQRLKLIRGRFAHPAGRVVHLVGLGIYLRERRGLVYGHFFYAQGYEQDRGLGAYLAQVEAVMRRQRAALELSPEPTGAAIQAGEPGQQTR